VPQPARSFLDRPLARGLAGVLFVACVAALAWLERDRLFPPEGGAAADDPVAACFAARAAEIDGMVAEGLIKAPQAELFKTRAEALCRATAGGAAPDPGRPAN
jgi:hypothetical protein